MALGSKRPPSPTLRHRHVNERPVSLLGLSPQFEHQKKLSFVFLSLALCPPLGSVTYSSTPTDQEHGYGEFFLERDASSF